MNFAQELCVIDETFHTVCGHVITRIKHEDDRCLYFNHNPYLEGQYIQCLCRAYHISQATILDSSSEIQSRREFCARYTEEQRTHFARQAIFEFDAETAAEGYEVGLQLHEEGSDELTEEILDRLGLNIIRFDRTRNWYLAQQNYYFGQVRNGIPEAELASVYEETDPNPAILAPVLPADFPDDEICGICRQPLHHPEAGGLTGLRRVFCGFHIFHHDCILPWFREGAADTISCPTCRASRTVIVPPDFSDIVPLQ